jgi:hypothetical protein
VYEKEQQTNNTNISTGISKFLDYWDTTNYKEMSTEISAIFQKMQIEEKVLSFLRRFQPFRGLLKTLFSGF